MCRSFVVSCLNCVKVNYGFGHEKTFEPLDLCNRKKKVQVFLRPQGSDREEKGWTPTPTERNRPTRFKSSPNLSEKQTVNRRVCRVTTNFIRLGGRVTTECESQSETGRGLILHDLKGPLLIYHPLNLT